MTCNQIDDLSSQDHFNEFTFSNLILLSLFCRHTNLVNKILLSFRTFFGHQSGKTTQTPEKTDRGRGGGWCLNAGTSAGRWWALARALLGDWQDTGETMTGR